MFDDCADYLERQLAVEFPAEIMQELSGVLRNFYELEAKSDVLVKHVVGVALLWNIALFFLVCWSRRPHDFPLLSIAQMGNNGRILSFDDFTDKFGDLDWDRAKYLQMLSALWLRFCPRLEGSNLERDSVPQDIRTEVVAARNL